MRPSARVRLHSLASRNELNGRDATLVECVDGRWNALLDGEATGEGIAIKPSNLFLLPDAFEVRSIDGKGFGCIAIRDIVLGERLLAEPPLTIEGDGLPSIEESVASLSDAERNLFFGLAQDEQLFGAGTSKDIEGIIGTNGIPFTAKDGTECGGVFAIVSRLNHSCCASCSYRWNAELHQLTIHACRNVKAGEELTIDYDCYGGFARREVRRKALKESFGFECACEKCRLEGEALMASEERIDQIGDSSSIANELLKRVALPELSSNDAAVVLRSLEERYALIEAEGGDGDGGVHPNGTDTVLQGFAEFCDEAATRLRRHAGDRGGAIPPAAGAVVETKVRAYEEATRRWAAEAARVTRIVCGEDSRAYAAWVEVAGGGAPLAEVFVSGRLRPSPLAVALSWRP